MIEEHVIKIVERQAELDGAEKKADFASVAIDRHIIDAEAHLVNLKKERDINRFPHIECAKELKTNIASLYEQIIDEWDGEEKTLKFAAGTLKFTTRGSLNILDEVWLLNDILDRMSVEDIFKKKYLKGFNLTAVKKYMSVHDLPVDVAEIEYTTTVKLEQTSG